MSLYEHETQPSDLQGNDTLSLPEMSEYLLAMRHELRAPLNAIIGMSALLLDDDVTLRQAQYVKSVHAAGESLSVILNDVLDLASVAANRLAIEPIPFDLKSMIEETASALAPKANERGLALRVDWRPELPRYLVGDPGRTRQVIGNLVGYAVNGTTHGEVVIRVTPDGERSGIPAIRFSVEDTGIGIAPNRLARIFDEYVPLDASPYRSFGVTGLGLRLSAELVRLMNGVIHAESEPGRGNRLWFSIPMPTAAQYETGVGTEPALTGGGRALIVEADFSNRSRFAQQFQDAGWRVEFTDDIDSVGAQLRQAITEGDPYRTCIISHYAVRPIHMELARDLKTDSLLAPVALVMVTAVGSPGDGQKLWSAGFAAYLRKPVPAEEIRESLEALSRLGPTGKGNSLITRHSLAEIRNAQSFEVEGIDEMLASLTAPEESTTDSSTATAPSDVSAQLDDAAIQASAAEPTAEFTAEPVESSNEAGDEASGVSADANASTSLPPALGALLALPVPEVQEEQPFAADVTAVESDTSEALRQRQSFRGEASSQTAGGVEVPDVATSEASISAPEALDADSSTEALVESATSPSAAPEVEFDIEAEVEPARQSEPLLLAAPQEVSQDVPSEPAVLFGPAVPPIVESSASAPTLFRAELDILAPPAIAPTPEPVEAAVVAPDTSAAEAQLVFEVEAVEAAATPESTPTQGDTVSLATPLSALDSSEDSAPEVLAVEQSVETTVATDIAEDSAPESFAVEQSAEAMIATEISTDVSEDAVAASSDIAGADTGITLEATIAEHISAGEAAVDEPTAQLPASLIDGHQDALWESEPTVPTLEGLVTQADETIDAPSAVIESVTLTSPGDYLVDHPSEPVAIESAATDTMPAVDQVATAEQTETGRAEIEQAPVEVTSLIEQSESIESSDALEAAVMVEPTSLVESGSAVDADTSLTIEHGATETIETTETVVESSDAPIESILDSNETDGFAATASEPADADPDLEPEQDIDVSTFDVVSPQLLDQLSTGGGFFTQHVVTTFLRDGGAQVERLATAPDAQLAESLDKLAHAAEWVGAARLSALVADAAARFERTGRVGPTARITAALAEARTTLDFASPQGLPAELPAIGATFAEQLSPSQEGSGRLLAVTLANSFVLEGPVRASELRDAVAQGNTDAAQRLAQTLKGMCGLIGAEPLAKLAALVEADARLKRLGQTERYLTHIDLELERVRAFLDQARA